jgi:hypothetical protein
LASGFVFGGLVAARERVIVVALQLDLSLLAMMFAWAL